MNSEDRAFLLRSLELARRWEGLTGENPSVGALVVRDGKVISEAVHRGPGKAHAERSAIKKAISRFGKTSVEGATLYVSLEPCSSWGKTPPCTEIIREAGISRVVFGCWDPNPKNRKGVLVLRKDGIELDWPKGDLAQEFVRFYRPFDVFVNQGRPAVIVKVAQTLNGLVMDGKGRSRWITSEETRRLVHRRLRSRVSGIMTGIGTILADDPQLNVRGIKQKNRLLRVIVDSQLRTPVNSRVISNAGERLPVMIAVSDRVPGSRIKRFYSRIRNKQDFVEVVKIRKGRNGLDIEEVVKEAGKRMDGFYLLVEAGPTLISGLVEREVVDRLVVCTSKSLIGAGRNWLEIEEIGLDNRIYLDEGKVEDLGKDLWMEFDVRWNN